MDWAALSQQQAFGHALVNAEGVIVRCTPAFGRILSHDDGALVGTLFANIVAESERDLVITRLADLVTTPLARVGTQIRFLRPNGDTVWCLLELVEAKVDPAMLLATICVTHFNHDHEKCLQKQEKLEARLTEAMKLASQVALALAQAPAPILHINQQTIQGDGNVNQAGDDNQTETDIGS